MTLTMCGNGDLLLYRNSRGRPTKEQSEKMKCPEYMKAELQRLREEMNYEEGTEIVLAVSFATDEMIRLVHMYPEVFYMDVTGNTNRQKRDIFLMVVKDIARTHVGNVTVVPSGQGWVFTKIYQTFFIYLFGEITISRNRLALTDDDEAEHGPFDNCIQTMDCYKKSKHMLCVFHGVVLAFHADVYPLFPHKPGKSRELTDIGEDYGMSVVKSYVLYRILDSLTL